MKTSYEIYKKISTELNNGTRTFKEILEEAQREEWERKE